MYVVPLVVLYAFCVLPNADCAAEEGGQGENNKPDDSVSEQEHSSSTSTSSVPAAAGPSAPTENPVDLDGSSEPRPQVPTQGEQTARQQSRPGEGKLDEDEEFPYDDVMFNMGGEPPDVTGGAEGRSTGGPDFPYDDLKFSMLSPPLPPEATEAAEGGQEDSPSYEGASAGATGGDEGLVDLDALLEELSQEVTQSAGGASAATSDVAGGSSDAGGALESEEASRDPVLEAISSLKETLSRASELLFMYFRLGDSSIKEDLRETRKVLQAALDELSASMESLGLDLPKSSRSLHKRAQDILAKIEKVWQEDTQ